MDSTKSFRSQSSLRKLEENQILAMNHRKKCAVFSHNLERNGANKFLLNLLSGLSDDFDFELFSAKSGPTGRDFQDREIPVHILQVKDDGRLEDQLKEIQRFDFAIINTIMLARIVLICEQHFIPHIWIIHEVWPRQKFHYYAKEVFLMSHVVNKEMIIEAFERANKIIFPSKAQHKLYSDLLNEDRVEVIYNGIPIQHIETYKTSLSQQEVRRNLGYDKGDIIILHIGTVCRRKAQKLTVSAFAKYCDENQSKSQNARLLIVGARYIRPHEVQYLDEVNVEIKNKELEDKVKILDIDRKVWPYYLAADVVVCPSINDALPLVIGEAMACKRPVIASTIGGIPEALDDGYEGFLIPCNDVFALASAMGKLLNDKQLRIQMGLRGRDRILKQFSINEMVGKYRQVISIICPEYFLLNH